jgi:hypothetical protein
LAAHCNQLPAGFAAALVKFLVKHEVKFFFFLKKKNRLFLCRILPVNRERGSWTKIFCSLSETKSLQPWWHPVKLKFPFQVINIIQQHHIIVEVESVNKRENGFQTWAESLLTNRGSSKDATTTDSQKPRWFPAPFPPSRLIKRKEKKEIK